MTIPLLIAHRGNTKGPNPERENEPNYVEEAISQGYAVEVDLWIQDGEPYLGHDQPQYLIDEDWIESLSEHLWFHCKNLEAMLFMNDIDQALGIYDYFWHQEDDYALTSTGYVWVYPGKPLSDGVICVMPENANYRSEDIARCSYVCSDYVDIIKKAGVIDKKQLKK